MKQNSGDKNLENFQFFELCFWFQNFDIIFIISFITVQIHIKKQNNNKNNNNNILPTWKNKYTQSNYNEADIDRNISRIYVSYSDKEQASQKER